MWRRLASHPITMTSGCDQNSPHHVGQGLSQRQEWQWDTVADPSMQRGTCTWKSRSVILPLAEGGVGAVGAEAGPRPQERCCYAQKGGPGLEGALAATLLGHSLLNGVGLRAGSHGNAMECQSRT